MKQAKDLTTQVAVLALAITLLGCATKNDVTAPNPGTHPDTLLNAPKVPTTVIARSPLSQIGLAGADAVYVPTVVVLDQTGKPMKDVNVSFAVTGGGGSVSTQNLVATQGCGCARAAWRLGNASGENTLTATVAEIQPVLFKAYAVVPNKGTRWDLQFIGSDTLPLTRSYSDGTSDTITGGQYVFVDDSTYTLGYDINGVEGISEIGAYIRLDSSQVEFFLPGSEFYDETEGLLSTGIIKGDVMTVTYQDWDTAVETYTRSAASSNAIASAAPTLTVKGPARRPPTVVRSDPSKGRTDVAPTWLSVQGERTLPANRISKGRVSR